MRLRSSLACVVLGACNWTYGLGHAVEHDATFYDATAAHCPPLGVVPEIDHADLREIIPQDCTHYTRSSGSERALASCNNVISEGLPDEPLAPAPGFEASTGYTYESPSISGDGNFAIVGRSTLVTFDRDSALMHRDADRWVTVSSIGMYSSASNPTLGPHPHVIAVSVNSLVELVDDGNGNWTLVDTIPSPPVLSVHLSPDGLRAVTTEGSVDTAVTYFDRTDIDSPLVERGSIERSGGFQYAFMSADCGRLYFSTLHGVWFAHQR